MRKGWEYKKLGEIITPAKVLKNGDRMDYPILSITMRSGIILQNERFKKTIASVDTSNYKVVQNGQLVIAFPIDEGLIYTQDIVEAGIMSPAYNIWNVDYSEMNRRFLVTYLHSPYAMSYYKSKLRGTTMRRRSIPKADLLNLTVPFPSLDKQVKIIEELDKINELIRLKKEQLKDFDNLAQSLFYEMFGDPVENEKGWEVKKLGELLKVIGGYAFKSDKYQEVGIPILRIGNINSGVFRDINLVFAESDEKLERYKIFPGDIVISLTGTVGKSDYGNVCIMDDTYNFYYLNQRNAKLEIFGNLDKYYLSAILKNEVIKSRLTSISRGVRQANIANKDIENLQIPLPPLSLQHLFAQRIEQIEREKSEVQKSIQDLETLLASRMQYWFE